MQILSNFLLFSITNEGLAFKSEAKLVTEYSESLIISNSNYQYQV